MWTVNNEVREFTPTQYPGEWQDTDGDAIPDVTDPFLDDYYNQNDTYGDGLNPEPVSVASIGGFGDFSLGLNYVKILDAGTAAGAKQLNASIRGDLRIGENVSDAYSVTAQVRLSF